MTQVPKQIVEVAQQLKNGQVSKRYKVRAVLRWFGALRRGAKVLSDIKIVMSNLGLQTDPIFDEADIDDHVRFVLVSAAIASGHGSRHGSTRALSEETLQSIPVDNPPIAMPPADADGSSDAAEAGKPSDDQLEPEPEPEEEHLTQKPDDRPITSQIRDWTIGSLREKLDRGQLDLQPKFQREYVWNQRPELPSRLIESVLLEIPIPPIYFGKVSEGRLEIIDGQQRLTTLIDFVSNKFSLRKLQRMASLNHKLFRNLTEEQQEKIRDTPVRSIVIDSGTNTDLKYEVFERLNRGSMTLNEQELRNCVYRGPFNDLLAELEMDSNWRSVKGGEMPDGRFKEREVILRFLAFANRLAQYGGNLKRFLNEYMGQYAPRELQDLKAHAALFKQMTQHLYAVFGDKAARLYEIGSRTNRGGWDTNFSVTAFDIQASALMNQSSAKVQNAAEQIREQYLFTVLTDVEMQDALAKHTGGTSQTKLRWTKFRELIAPVIAGTLVEPRFFDFEFRKDLFDRSPVCQLCKSQIHSLDDSTVDHITPYSKGGKTVPENGQLAHRGCNARKNAQLPATAATAA
jgi:hypothetical protein